MYHSQVCFWRDRFILGYFWKVNWMFRSLYPHHWGDMCLHNYLVEYRNVHTVEDESLDNMVKEANIERDVFKSDCSDRGTIHCYR